MDGVIGVAPVASPLTWVGQFGPTFQVVIRSYGR